MGGAARLERGAPPPSRGGAAQAGAARAVRMRAAVLRSEGAAPSPPWSPPQRRRLSAVGPRPAPRPPWPTPASGRSRSKPASSSGECAAGRRRRRHPRPPPQPLGAVGGRWEPLREAQGGAAERGAVPGLPLPQPGGCGGVGAVPGPEAPRGPPRVGLPRRRSLAAGLETNVG